MHWPPGSDYLRLSWRPSSRFLARFPGFTTPGTCNELFRGSYANPPTPGLMSRRPQRRQSSLPTTTPAASPSHRALTKLRKPSSQRFAGGVRVLLVTRKCQLAEQGLLSHLPTERRTQITPP